MFVMVNNRWHLLCCGRRALCSPQGSNPRKAKLLSLTFPSLPRLSLKPVKKDGLLSVRRTVDFSVKKVKTMARTDLTRATTKSANISSNCMPNPTAFKPPSLGTITEVWSTLVIITFPIQGSYLTLCNQWCPAHSYAAKRECWTSLPSCSAFRTWLTKSWGTNLSHNYFRELIITSEGTRVCFDQSQFSACFSLS